MKPSLTTRKVLVGYGLGFLYLSVQAQEMPYEMSQSSMQAKMPLFWAQVEQNVNSLRVLNPGGMDAKELVQYVYTQATEAIPNKLSKSTLYYKEVVPQFKQALYERRSALLSGGLSRLSSTRHESAMNFRRNVYVKGAEVNQVLEFKNLRTEVFKNGNTLVQGRLFNRTEIPKDIEPYPFQLEARRAGMSFSAVVQTWPTGQSKIIFLEESNATFPNDKKFPDKNTEQEYKDKIERKFYKKRNLYEVRSLF